MWYSFIWIVLNSVSLYVTPGEIKGTAMSSEQKQTAHMADPDLTPSPVEDIPLTQSEEKEDERATVEDVPLTQNEEKEDERATIDAQDDEDTTPVAAVRPASRPRPGQVITPRQERALRYLERKQARQERLVEELMTAPAAKQSVLPQATLPQAQQKDLSPPPSLATIPLSRGVLVVPPSTSIATFQPERWQRHRKMLLRHMARKRIRGAREREQRTSHRFWLAVISTLAALFVAIFSLVGTGTFAAYKLYDDTQTKYLPRVITLRDLLPRDNLKMYDRKGVLIGQLTDQGIHTSVSLDHISPYLINATIATEDKNFWNNPGVDIPRIIQATIDNLQEGRVVEGGSTITQQLIKKLVVGDEVTMLRKLQEVMVTPELNNRYTKRDILEMYLNSIYYGQQAYGVNAAATVYFGLEDKPGKPAAEQLTLAQAALLAGLPNSPYAFDPFIYPDASFARLEVVLESLFSQGYITKVEMQDAIKEAHNPKFFKRPASLKNRAPHFFNFVLTQLQQTFHLKREQLSRSDMQVHTTLDIGLQDKIQKIAQQHIASLRNSNYHVTNAAEVLIDYHTGEILSLLGSIDYNNKSINGQFDVATQGYRQPGSSFKPYVYVTAFDQGASPAQAIVDEPLTINLPGADPPTFTPHNYDLGYHGHMTLRCALQNSLNIPAVKVLQHVGIDKAMKTAHDMGISSYQGTPGYSLVLGGLGVRLLDHTSAFGTFANNGLHVSYYAVEKVTFASTHQTWKHERNKGKQVISPQLAYMMTSVLSDNTSRLPQFFDCNVLQLYANSQADCWRGNRGVVRPAAAKTGTTNSFRDNWALGYTADFVMGVWAGNNDNTPMGDVTGVHGAAPIWHDALLVASQGRPIRDFVNPGGLEKATVTYADGVKTTDWFIPGTVPTVTAKSVPTPTIKVTPTPGTKKPGDNAEKKPAPPPVRPYCSHYTFDHQPPAPSGKSPSSLGWW
jgi:membrane peptidoglycan carboxypeptidase